MTASPTPPSTPFTGNRRIVFLPSSVSNPLSLAAIIGATAKDLTFSFTPTGWRPNISENRISDGRLAQLQVLDQPGNFSEALEAQYVYGDPTRDVAKTVLLDRTLGWIVDRDSIPNATDWALAQIVDVYAIKCGKQRKDPPAENALQTITQGIYLTAPTLRDQALVA